MTFQEGALGGGAGRLAALAVRTTGYADALVCLAEPVEPVEPPPPLRVLAHHGQHGEALLASAAEVLAGRTAGPSYVGAPLHDASGTVVGVLCLGGPPAGRETTTDADTVAAFAAVLSDQLDPTRTVGPPPDPADVARLRVALAGGEVRAWFQPIVDLVDHRLVGLEALARWIAPDGTVTTPGEFVRLAERSGLVVELDLAVLRDGLHHLARWHRHSPDLRLSVNVSGRHLDHPGWLDGVAAAVAAAGVDPRTVELELTESARPSDVVRNAGELVRARELGFEVWFDDFGTGWADLRQLVELPVDGVKVDRFFTEELGGRGDAVVRAVVGMAADLGLDTVVEGISTAAHAHRARELGGRLGQGYWWSPPVPAAEVDAVLAGTSGAFSAAGR